jgi:hypothetical protein
MAWVEQIGAQTWRVRYTDRQRHQRSLSGFSSEQQARDYAADLIRDRRRGTWVDPADGQLTFGAWTDSWITRLNVAERTEENYRRNLRRHLLPHWAETPLAAITPRDVTDWVGMLQAAGYAPNTVNTLLKLLSQLLGDAVEARVIGQNPVRRRPHRGPRVITPVAERV